ncbi:MAG: N-acetyldiaminopimelate deacetylase [Candidatus Cloacimonadota bacterium]|nr:MAG: N-acetyldiaminopimelate deacetylase [Candidatus Cloacimonadota bacterium]PIE81760.1 MAG: N-acetyldiaminopimelate deacetylase [Candidatus Delongbacteria bacterium]
MKNYKEIIKSYREDLHKIPEIAYSEIKTSKYIKTVLERLGCFSITSYAKTGLVAEYRVNDDKFVAFRTDIDALPLKELTDLSFKSTHEGFMHACGHDVHMSIMLGVAEYIEESRPNRNIALIFQPAEEGNAGAKRMIDEGLFRDREIEEIYALHTSPKFRTGSIGINNNKMFAGTVEFSIELKGVGGHAAYPHLVNDVNTAGATLVLNLNTITSRFLDPIHEKVISIGCIKGGSVANVMPEKFTLHGTARSYSKEDLKRVKQKLKDMSEGVALSYGLESTLKIVSEYVPLINNKETAEKIIKSAKSMGVEVIDCAPEMTGEDFGFMNSEVSGSIYWLGVAYDDDKKNFNLHNPKYSPNEESFINGFNIFKGIIGNS